MARACQDDVTAELLPKQSPLQRPRKELVPSQHFE